MIEPDDPIQYVSESLDGLTRAVRDLGNGNASTHMGAIEAHSVQIVTAAELIEAGLSEVASALRAIAEAINPKGTMP